MLIPAFQKDEQLRADLLAWRGAAGFQVWWLGQSGFLLHWQGRYLLFDPYLSDSLTRKYAGTAKPHVRMSERAIDPALLDMVDIVTSSHNHTDHLDAETLIPLLAANPGIRFVVPEANRAFVAERVQCDPGFPLGMNDGDTLELNGFRFTCVPAAHNTIERDEAGRCKFVGYVVQFGPYAVYHSGDTLWYAGMADLLKPFAVDLAFLPINGNKPERGVAGNLDCAEAAELGRQIGARCVIPHHYDLFEFNTADVQAFVREAETRGMGYRVLRVGERAGF
jgi:L-ascorbate metabolism protein UlaG (beta-lactamase superfamily)